MSMSSEVIVTYLNIVLYAVSYQLQRPVEPFLVRSLIHNQSDPNGGSDDEESTANQTYGRLTSFFSLLQTVGSPLVGTLLDRIGPRRTSVLCYGASALSYWILSRATTPAWLYASKVPTLLQHAFLVGQATVASSAPGAGATGEGGWGEGAAAKGRAAALGRMTTAYTVGATIGPALGGHLASTDLYAGARLAVWGSLVSVVLSVAYLKDHAKKAKGRDSTPGTSSSPSQQSAAAGAKQRASFVESFRRTLSFLRHPAIGPLLFVKLLNGVSSSAFATALPLILANELRFSTARMGWFMSASSLSVAAFGAAGIAPAMAAAGDRPDRLALAGIGGRLASTVALGAIVSRIAAAPASSEARGGDGDTVSLSTGGLAAVTLASVAASLSSHAHATSLTTLTTGAVPPEERGAMLGLEHGLFSMARVAGPPLGTTLLSWGSGSGSGDGLWRVIAACALMDFALVVLLRVWSARRDAEAETIGNEAGDDGRVCIPLVEDRNRSD